jgi:hypothetical protein
MQNVGDLIYALLQYAIQNNWIPAMFVGATVVGSLGLIATIKAWNPGDDVERLIKYAGIIMMAGAGGFFLMAFIDFLV